MSLSLLVIIQSVTNSAFYIETVSLVHILLHDLSQTTEKHKVMPIGMVGHFHTIGQGVSFLRSSERHLSHRLIRIVIMHIGFLSHITNQHYLIHRFSFYKLVTSTFRDNGNGNSYPLLKGTDCVNLHDPSSIPRYGCSSLSQT